MIGLGTLGRTVLVVAGLMACGGCGAGSSTSCEPETATLSGQIAGQDWTFAQGSTNSFLSHSVHFFGNLYSATYSICGDSGQDLNPHLKARIPTAPGTFELSVDQSVMFFLPTTGAPVVTSGKIVVDTVTASAVSGSLCAELDADNTVSGTFTVDICP